MGSKLLFLPIPNISRNQLLIHRQFIRADTDCIVLVELTKEKDSSQSPFCFPFSAHCSSLSQISLAINS